MRSVGISLPVIHSLSNSSKVVFEIGNRVGKIVIQHHAAVSETLEAETSAVRLVDFVFITKVASVWWWHVLSSFVLELLQSAPNLIQAHL